MSLKTLQLYIIALLFLACSLDAVAQNENHFEEATESFAAQKEILKIGKQGFSPTILSLYKQDSSVFFLNDFQDQLITLEIDFGNRVAHCASGNMKFSNGQMVSIQPLGAKDFAIVCFPEKGKYLVKAYDSSADKNVYESWVIVE